MQGAVVDETSTMPQLVAWSTCEAEYCMGALVKMGAFYIGKVHNDLHGIDPDYQLIVPTISNRHRHCMYPIKRPKEPDALCIIQVQPLHLFFPIVP
jgi:hypothetical protein